MQAIRYWLEFCMAIAPCATRGLTFPCRGKGYRGNGINQGDDNAGQNVICVSTE